jgi:hypothetical protein
MHLVSQYRQFASDCRRLAALLTRPDDKHALELFAIGWDKVADDREAMLHIGETVRRSEQVPSRDNASVCRVPGLHETFCAATSAASPL